MEKLPEGKQPALRVMPMPADANQNGDIFGGWIMAQVDVAGGTLAGKIARGRIATVAVKEFVFKQPVQIGDLLSFYAEYADYVIDGERLPRPVTEWSRSRT